MKKVGAFAVVILALLLFIILNVTTIFSYIEEDGFVMPKNSLSEVMTDISYSESDNVSLIEIEESDFISESFGNYYVEDKIQIDLNYPLIVRDSTALMFVDTGSYLLSDEFDFAPTTVGSVVSDQTYFNMDGGTSDDCTYILSQLRNGLFVTNTSFTVTTILETFEISQFAIVYFSEDYINVYNYVDGYYEYMAIRGLQTATITYNDTTMSYDEFYIEIYNVSELIKVELEEEEDVKEEIKELIESPTASSPGNTVPDEADPPEDPPEIPQVEKPSEESDEPGEPSEPVEPAYVKPEVTVSDIDSWVYSINIDIEVYDPSSRIKNNIIFNVYDDEGTLILRDTTKSSGLVNLTTLPPDSTLVVEAYFSYYNEQGIEVTEYILEKTVIYTDSFDDIPEISLTYDQSEILYSEAMGLDNMLLSNTTAYDSEIGDDEFDNFCLDILPYVYSMKIIFTDEETGKTTEISVPSSTLSSLRKSEIIDYISTSKLSPDTQYTYEILAYDRYGNQFTFAEDVTGTYATCKETPTVLISVTSKSADSTIFKLTLSDSYDTIVDENYTVKIYYGDEVIELDYVYGSLVSTADYIEISTSATSSTIEITNLPYATSFKIVATASYDINDNNGTKEDEVIGELSFYSAGIPSGTVTYNNSFDKIGGTTVTMSTVISTNSTVDLVNLITDVTMYFDTDGQSLSYTYTKEQFDAVDIDEFYDHETGTLTIISGDSLTLTPELTLVADYDALMEYGAWQTFCNSGLYGSSDVRSGTLIIELMQGTLLSSSHYDFDMTSIADVGSSAFDVTSFVLNDEFYTLKAEPTIYYEDYFIGANIIEFYNVSITDEDDVIIGDIYSIQILQDGQVIESFTLDASVTQDVIHFDGIETGYEYTIQFVASEYNLTIDEDQLQTQFVMKSFIFYNSDGIQADIDITNMRYSYNTYFQTEGYGYISDYISNPASNYQENTYFNITTNEIEEKEGYFTISLPYTGNSEYYSIFSGFVDYGDILYLAFYNGSGTFIGDTSSSNYEWFQGFGETAYSSQFKYTTATTVVVTGAIENLNSAYYFQYDSDDKETIIDTTVDASDFEEYVAIGTTTSDYVSTSYYSSDFYDCEPGEILSFTTSSDYLRIYFFDSNDDYISSCSIYYTNSNVITVPSNAASFRVMVQTSIMESESSYFKLYRVAGTDDLSIYAELELSVTDTTGDQFFLINENNDTSTYTLTKYEAEISSNQTYDSYLYQYVEEIEFDEDGNIDVTENWTEKMADEKAYKYVVSIEYNGHTIILDELEFTTDNFVYIVTSTGDLSYIYYDRYGTYLVVQDIVQDANAQRTDMHFNGILDFQGYSFTFTKGGYTSSEIFDYLFYGGEIKNGEFILPDDEVCQGLVNYNYGTISNIKYTIYASVDNSIETCLIDYNQAGGVIENFVIELNGDVLFYNEDSTEDSAIFVRYNSGEIENGYIYNTDNEATVYLYGRSGILTFNNTTTGSIRNIYADVDIASNYDQQTATWSSGIISAYNQGSATNMFAIADRNNFSFDSGTGTVIDGFHENDDDPLFGNLSATNMYDSYEDIYLLSEYEDYDSDYITYFTAEVLHDTDWYSTVFNDENNFLVVDMVSQGYFPILDLDSSMSSIQLYRELPELVVETTPTFLYSDIFYEGKEYVDVTLVFTNPSKLSISTINMADVTVDGEIVESVGATVYNQTVEGEFYIVTVRLENANTYGDEYLIESFTYRTSTGATSTKTINEVVEASFYYPISTFSDFAIIETHLDWNYRLANDIDFSTYTGSWSDIYVNGSFSGTFDGGRYDALGELIGNYTISNVDLTGSNSVSALFFYEIRYGEVKNINYSNISWQNDTGTDASIIYRSYYSVVDNVHIDDISLTSYYRCASLVNLLYGSLVQNCSASNVTITNGDIVSSGFTAGGLIGYANYSTIQNSFVYNLEIETHDLDLSNRMGCGGIVGEINSSVHVLNCYATGYITNPSYNGGISGTGTGYIDSCFTNVIIVADGDFNGGISGNTSSTYIHNCLVLGDIITMTLETTYTHRISSTDHIYTTVNNYAYEGQVINDDPSLGSDFSEGVLSYDSLIKEDTYIETIQFGTEYDYSDISTGMLPKLCDTNGELLANQSDIYLEDLSVKLTVDYTNYNGADTYKATISVDHTGYTIKEVIIDGMQITTFTEVDTQSDVRSQYNYEMTKTAALDLYLVTAVLVDEDGFETKLITTLDFDAIVYWEIENLAQWQDIMTDYGYSNENILIKGVIDFSTLGYDPLDGLSLNRLDGVDTETSQLINITIDSTTEDNLVNSVYSSISNLTIEGVDIEFTSTTTAKYNIGVFGVIQAKVDNLVINDVDMDISYIGSTYIGVIAKTSNQISNVTITNVTIDGDTQNAYRSVNLGALVGYSSSGISNVQASNITINIVNGLNVGAIVGCINKTDTNVVGFDNISATNITVNAAYQVGGLAGYLSNITPNNVSVNNVTIGILVSSTVDTGSSYYGCRFGGIAGYSGNTLYNGDIDENSVQNVTIVGNNYIGGVFGYGSAYYVNATNLSLTGDMYVGGIAGYTNSSYYNTISNSTITALEKFAGGIGGRAYQECENYVVECTITAESYAGGLAGFTGTYNSTTEVFSTSYSETIRCVVTNCTITTSEDHAGGLIGYVYSLGSSIYDSVVIDTTITAGTDYVGGLVGELSTVNLQNCYISGGSVKGNDYVGGLIGYVNHSLKDVNVDYNSDLFRSYSNTTVYGSDYVGGIFGAYYTDYSDSSKNYRQTFTLINFSDVIGTGANVYAVGYMDSNSELIIENYYYALTSYNEALINGVAANSSNLSNSTSSVYYVIDFDYFTNYTTVSGAMSSGNLDLQESDLDYFLSFVGRLGSFDIILDDISKDTTTGYINYDFEILNLDLPDGTYSLSIGTSTGTSEFANDVDIEVVDKKATYRLNFNSSTTTRNFYFTIANQDNTTIYAQESFTSVNYNYSVSDITVNGEDINYLYSETNEPVTITVDDASGNYVWYKIYSGQGYGATKVAITSYADGNSITLDTAGIYYAIDTTTGIYSEVFIYETNAYYPLVSSTYYNVLPFQSGYYYDSNGVPQSSYDSSLVYDGQVLGMILRNTMVETISSYSLQSLSLSGLSFEEIDYDIYSSGIDTINIEFDESFDYDYISTGIYVTLSSGDEEKTYEITSRVMSFSYDYVDDLEVTIFSGDTYNEELTPIYTSDQYDAEDLASYISVYGTEYYYITDDGIASDNQIIIYDEIIHIYNNMALSADGQIYDMTDSIVIEKIGDILYKVETVSVYISTYGESTLLTFMNFTYNETLKTVSETVVFVKDGVINAVSAEKASTSIIISDYTEETYCGYLNSSGSISELYAGLVLPDNFKNYNIVEISDTFNSSSTNTVVLVRYEGGDVVAFDYLTGQEVELEIEALTESFVSFALSSIASFSNMFNTYTTVDGGYEESQEVLVQIDGANTSELVEIEVIIQAMEQIEELDLDVDMEEIVSSGDIVNAILEIEEISIDIEAIEISVSNQEYVTVYNEEQQTYETYVANELVASSTDVQSMEDKIETVTQLGYEGQLNNLVASKVTTTVVSNNIYIFAFFTIIIIVAVLLIILRYKNKKVW